MYLIKKIRKFISYNILFFILTLTYLPLFNYFKILNQNGGHSFMTADWLINYQFGYINRGLIGTFLISIFENGSSLLNFLTYFLVVVYLLIFYFLNKLFKKTSNKIITLTLIFSPAGFLFPIYDSQASFRKEIIGILGLFIFISAVNTKEFKKYLLVSSFIFTIGIFSHSVNLFFIPTVLLILYIYQKSRDIFDYLAFSIPAIIFVIINLYFKQSEQKLFEIKNNLCSKMSDLELQNLCGYGSFDFITWDLNAHYLITQNFIINQNRESYYIYILFFVFSLLPYLFEKNIFTLLKIFSLIGVSFIPLFLIAYDWGRWIHIMSICYLSIYLLSDKNIYKSRFKYILLLYPFLFRMEHCCDTYFEFSINYLHKNILYIYQNFKNLLTIF